MSATCGEAAEEVTRALGFSCREVNPVISLNAPGDLSSWTQPVLEVLIIAGAVFALVHAVRRLRHHGDPINLALWFASLVYLAVTEPPLYFPEWFGLDEIYGFIFAHNEFTVQFMYDRLPLYIVAFYPAISALAYEVVRCLGVFKQRGPLVGAVAVGFVCQVFYEIFDHLGPQLTWWAWHQDNVQVNHPMLASVPLNSMLLFASVSFGVLTYLVVRWIGTPDQAPARSGRAVALRTVAAGVLTPLGMAVASIPSGVAGGDEPNITAQAWVLGIELALVWLAGIWILAQVARAPRDGESLPAFTAIFPMAYLVVHGVLWLTALPEFLAAEDGITSSGTPIGSGWYVLACFVAATAVLTLLYRVRRTSPAPVSVG